MKVPLKTCACLISFFALCLFTTSSLGQARRHTPARPTPSPTPPVTASSGPEIGLNVTGAFDGQTYSNPPLGFSLTLPGGWEAQDLEVQKRFAEKASERAADIAKEDTALKASIQRTTLLFILVLPRDGKTNPTVTALAEDIGLVFGVRTPRQYLESMRSIGYDDGLSFEDQVKTEKINGVEFAVLGATLTNPKLVAANVKQRYYVAIRHHHAVVFILTYSDAEASQLCMELLNSLKFG